MALSSFLKVIDVKYDTVNYPADTVHHLSRTFNDSVVSDENVSVSYNGTKIIQYKTGTLTSFAKYYYTVTIVPSTSITIDIYGNSAYTNPNYASGSVDCQISSTDLFRIEYTHEVTI